MASGLEGRQPRQPELACVCAGKRMLRVALCVCVCPVSATNISQCLHKREKAI